jgi:hypothetical protein
VMFGMTTMAGIEELTRVRYHGHQQCDHRGRLCKYGCAANCFPATLCPCVRCGAALFE